MLREGKAVRRTTRDEGVSNGVLEELMGELEQIIEAG
jgi:hypothetical protein